MAYSKLYLAGPWFTKVQNEIYEKALNILSNTENSKYECYIPKYNQYICPERTFDFNIKFIKKCDVLVALIDKKDVGTAWEIGMAYAKKKKIYLVGTSEDVFLKSKTNLMLAFTGKCILLENLGKLLTKSLTKDDYIEIPNDWEVIE